VYVTDMHACIENCKVRSNISYIGFQWLIYKCLEVTIEETHTRSTPVLFYTLESVQYVNTCFLTHSHVFALEAHRFNGFLTL